MFSGRRSASVAGEKGQILANCTNSIGNKQKIKIMILNLILDFKCPPLLY